MNEKRILMSSHLSKELRKVYGFRSFPIRTDDVVLVKVGKYKNREGKILTVSRDSRKVTIEGCTMTKANGGTAYYPIEPSNLEIKQLYLDDHRTKALENKKVIYDKTRAKYSAGRN